MKTIDNSTQRKLENPDEQDVDIDEAQAVSAEQEERLKRLKMALLDSQGLTDRFV